MLWETIRKLFEKRVVLDFTDHLTDRELYCLIWRDILPSPEKKIDNSSSYLHWDCSDASGDAQLWLRYYATRRRARAMGRRFRQRRCRRTKSRRIPAICRGLRSDSCIATREFRNQISTITSASQPLGSCATFRP